MERSPYRTTAFYLVSSIQYEVSDTMHVTKLGTEKKNKGKNKTCCIFTQSCQAIFNFMKKQ